jgi:hypothetical protein
MPGGTGYITPPTAREIRVPRPGFSHRQACVSRTLSPVRFGGTSWRPGRPSHATVVAYLALFIALATGVSWAATKITSSKQIAKNVVTGKHVKNGTLKGKDVKDGKLAGIDVKDGSLAAADLGANSVATAKIADGSVTGADINIGSLGFGKGFSATTPGSVAVDAGNGAGTPVHDLPGPPPVKRGDLVKLNLPAGKYFLTARALISAADGNGAGVLCLLEAGDQQAFAGTDSDDAHYTQFDVFTYGEISPSMIVTLAHATPATLSCADDQTNAEASNIRIDALSLVP